MRHGRLVDLQAQQVEVGRIRMGTSQLKTSNAGKEYKEPVKLDRFRLTSRSESLIQEAAGIYGGTPEPWATESGVGQWQVIIDRSSIQVIVPPNPVSQYYEQWAGGRVQRRCDGARELLQDVACLCGPDPANRRCKPYTRLSLMLAEMRGVGVWRLETHGYYAALELPAVADLLSRAGGNVPARLEMETRVGTAPDPRNPSKEVTVHFQVPVLHVEATPMQIVGVFGQPTPALEAAGPNGTVPALPAGPVQAEDQEAANVGWALRQKYEDAIAAATTRDQMMALRERMSNDPELPEDQLGSLVFVWRDRAAYLASQPPAAQPNPAKAVSAPAPASPPAAPATPPPDRRAVFNSILTWAGFKNWKTSDVAREFAAWGKGGEDVRTADAETLAQFKTWLEVQHA